MSALKKHIESVMKGDEKPGVLFLPLAVVAVFYKTIVNIKNFLYDNGLLKPQHANCEVICAGALTVGGAGKTPVVELLVRKLIDTKKVGILSRGYGGSPGKSVHVVSDGKGKLAPPPPVSADEPYMMAKKFLNIPVVCAPDRIAGAVYMAGKFGVEIIILDDGFQRRSMGRDFNIAVIPAKNPFGSGKIFPLGVLREPAKGVERADIVILTGNVNTTDDDFKSGEEKVRLYFGNKKPVIHASGKIGCLAPADKKEMPAPNGKALAFCAIASPERFFDSLKLLDIETCGSLSFLDHHNFADRDIEEINKMANDCGADFLVTTEKDMARLKRQRKLFNLPIFCAEYRIEIVKGEEEFDKAVASISR